MIVHDSAAHTPEALAKGHGILRLRLRLVCCIIPHTFVPVAEPRLAAKYNVYFACWMRELKSKIR